MAAIQTLTLQRLYVLSHHRDTEGPLIADWRLRISDLELMNSFSIRAIRNPQFNGFSVHLRVLHVSYTINLEFLARLESFFLCALGGWLWARHEMSYAAARFSCSSVTRRAVSSAPMICLPFGVRM